jgi:hypothetical protein
MMRAFGTGLLFIALGALLLAGLIRVMRDLLSRAVVADPHSAAEDALSESQQGNMSGQGTENAAACQ